MCNFSCTVVAGRVKRAAENANAQLNWIAANDPADAGTIIGRAFRKIAASNSTEARSPG